MTRTADVTQGAPQGNDQMPTEQRAEPWVLLERGLSWACPHARSCYSFHFPGQHLHWERVSEHCTGQEHEKPKLCKENIPGTFSGSGSEGTSGSSNCSCKDIEDNVSHVPQTTAVGKDWGWQCPRLPPRLSSESRKRHFICCYSSPKMWISITRTSTPPE